MSANIPFDIQVDIIKRVLPVKSLIRLRSVSKQWKSLIDSSKFITDHSVNQTQQPHHVLVRYYADSDSEFKYVLIVDDNSFPEHKFSPFVTPTVKLARNARMVDSSHGLVCLYGYAGDVRNSMNLIVVWNPSIRKSVGILLRSGFTALGFGVCPKTIDPKIVKITPLTSMNWKAEVFTLSSGVWRKVYMNFKMVSFLLNQVVIDNVIHWLAYDFIGNFALTRRYFIISFDLTSEEFEKVDLPDYIARSRNLVISKLSESLVLLDYHESDSGELVCDIWRMLKDGILKSSFTKLSTVNVTSSDCSASYKIYGFRKNGQPIVKQIYSRRDGFPAKELEVYEPVSEHIKGIGIYGSFFRSSYTESLLLLKHSESIIHRQRS